MTAQATGLIATRVERLKKHDGQARDPGVAALIHSDAPGYLVQTARSRDQREEWPADRQQPVQDRPEPDRPPVREPVSDDEERYDLPPLYS
jgi:hypothetical protein